MKKFKLNNGLTVVWEQRDSDSIAIEVSVKTGSNNEQPKIAGISHFLEHMVFEGTATRSAKQISETIEDVGGELNAATSNNRTFFYIKLPKNKAELGFDILSDIIRNPAFRKDSLEKERKVILEEIKMVDDQPLLYQWVLFESTIFKKHPTRNPVYGNRKAVKATTRANMLSYYRKWYIPNNMTLSVVGNATGCAHLVKKYFGSMKKGKVSRPKPVSEPIDKKPTIKRQKRDINQSYLVFGFKTVPRLHKDSFALDLISSIFSKGLSGRINTEIRVKRGLAYSVGTHHESKTDYGFFAVYLNCDRKNLELCKSLILQEIKNLDTLTNKEISAAKEHITGRTLLGKEDSQKRAESLAFWESIKDANLADKYLKSIKNVSKKDMIRARDRFLKDNYTIVVIGR
jgi:predicted Zn-dependent peptidase